jgi:hypothetical protein
LENPNPLYTDFKNEVAQGKWNPSQEDVDKLFLVPHFDPSGLAELDTELLLPDGRFRTRLASLNPAQQEKLKSRARNRARHSYEKAFGKVQGLNSPEEENLGDDSYQNLKKAVQKLATKVHNIDYQNEILTGHLELLQRAKEQLECQAQCAIEAIKWKRTCIGGVRAQHPIRKTKSLGHMSTLSRLHRKSVYEDA